LIDAPPKSAVGTIIKVKKSKLICPMSITLKDQAGNEIRTIECVLPRLHLGRCTDGASYWQMPKKFLDKLEAEVAEEERRARLSKK
jgi:hypothetical protein